jgi:hypothetical protein
MFPCLEERRGGESTAPSPGGAAGQINMRCQEFSISTTCLEDFNLKGSILLDNDEPLLDKQDISRDLCR